MSASNLRPDRPSPARPSSGPPALDPERVERVLFLCSGNIMRSAFAELWARHRGFPRPVESAASTYRNDRIHPATARELVGLGVEPSTIRRFAPRHLDLAAAALSPSERAATLVLGMTGEHIACAASTFPAAQCLLLESLAGPAIDVPDPIDHPDPRPVFDRIARLVDLWGRWLGASAP